MTSTRAKSRAVFIDRDGTIMHDADYCSDPKQVQIFEGAAAALSRLKKAGYKILVITNQRGIGRGFFTEKQYRAVEAEVSRQLGHALIDATYFCPDAPGKSSKRRKPTPRMLLAAARDDDVALSHSSLMGDNECDP